VNYDDPHIRYRRHGRWVSWDQLSPEDQADVRKKHQAREQAKAAREADEPSPRSRPARKRGSR
jgi:hypothetical protein